MCKKQCRIAEGRCEWFWWPHFVLPQNIFWHNHYHWWVLNLIRSVHCIVVIIYSNFYNERLYGVPILSHLVIIKAWGWPFNLVATSNQNFPFSFSFALSRFLLGPPSMSQSCFRVHYFILRRLWSLSIEFIFSGL